MTWIGSFYRSALGKKAVMAVTGVMLFGWIVAHMLGNLKIFLPGGPQHLNEYAAWLKVMGAPLVPAGYGIWITRIVMLIAIWLHIQSATQLTLMDWAARPNDYERRRYAYSPGHEVSSYATRTMRWGGVIILLFIIYHLLHLTFGAHVAPAAFIEGDVYHNVVAGFQYWWVSAIYIIANLALGLHLFHGLRAMFDSLGLNHSRFNLWRYYFAVAFAVIVTAGNISIPVAVLTGVLH